MSFTPNHTLVPDRDNLPLKKRDQRHSSVPPPLPQQQQLLQQQQQQCDAVTFKAPYPHKSHSDFRAKHISPFQPVPKRVPALYQPWMQTTTKPQVLSAFREHHGWAEWREFNPLHRGWDFSHHYQHHNSLAATPAFHLGHPHHSTSSVSPVNEGFQRMGGGYNWEQLKTLKDKSLSTERLSNGRSKGPYVRRRDKKMEYVPGVEKTAPLSLSTHLPHPPHRDLTPQLHKYTKAAKHPVSGHSFLRVSPDTYTPMKEGAPPSSPSSSSANRFPWLLPHFVAGSLIELRDGQLRKVEHLQTEDFLLGSLACPDLRLSCCTVQSISLSASSAAVSRLLILLHDQQTQELVDVYMEYPFFVRGQGWSSCSPQRTARLCGLQCRQLTVGDVCLALTPVSASRPPPSANTEPKASPRKPEGGCEFIKAQQTQLPPVPEQSAGGLETKSEAVRRRHHSAPELRGQRTDCME